MSPRGPHVALRPCSQETPHVDLGPEEPGMVARDPSPIVPPAPALSPQGLA